MKEPLANKLPTAEEFLKENSVVGMIDLMVPLMTEFAILHCKAQLEAVLENLSMIQECGSKSRETCNAVRCNSCWRVVDTDSIINAYNLNNIK